VALAAEEALAAAVSVVASEGVALAEAVPLGGGRFMSKPKSKKTPHFFSKICNGHCVYPFINPNCPYINFYLTHGQF
jgi:hypothetical protein